MRSFWSSNFNLKLQIHTFDYLNLSQIANVYVVCQKIVCFFFFLVSASYSFPSLLSHFRPYFLSPFLVLKGLKITLAALHTVSGYSQKLFK